MSTTSKVVITLVVLVIAIVGSWLYFSGAPDMSTTSITASTSDTALQNSNQTATSSVTSNGSNTSVAQDTAAIDAQMNGLNSDSASTNQSLNDKPVQQ
jgi:hypothetical protein